MSSCLSSRAYGFNLEHMVKWPNTNSTATTTSNPSSPSSTLSESSNSPIQKPRTPRKRPNQTYNEAAALLSMASPRIFKIKHLTKRTANLNLLPKFTKQNGYFFDKPPELILNSGFLRIMKKPCFLTDLKIKNSCQKTGEIDNFVDLIDFDTELIFNGEIEQGIDSIMGEYDHISEKNELGDKLGSDFNACCGYGNPMGRNRVRALKNADEGNWWDFPMVDLGVVNTSPADVAKCAKSPVGKKKKKKKKPELRQGDFGSGDRNVSSRLALKLDYDSVLDEWADKGLPLPEEILQSSSPGSNVQAMAAKIDLFSEDGDWDGSMDQNILKVRQVKKAYHDKLPRCIDARDDL